ncbi:hypothetical protein M8818_001796 [Zalaria obscura]|uniref:Uncharacterized protein n=1 Tax=Zalaria obscura TaxID=2024903 RepID=A0ACC3SJD5_9PEZI
MATPVWSTGSDYVPQGFTVTEYECTMCGETPQTLTITEPCGCEATNGVPVTATPAATGSGSGPTPTGSSGSGSGSGTPGSSGSGSGTPGSSEGSSSPSSGSGSGSGEASSPGASSNAGGSTPAAETGGSSAPYPTTTTVACPGSACRAAASNAPAGGVSYGNTSGIEPWTGAAVPMGVSWQMLFTACAGVAVAGLAVLL